MLGSMLDFSQPPPQAKTLEEAQALIDVLWVMVRDLRLQVASQEKRFTEQLAAQQREIDTLKERLNTYSGNSSKPPSSDLPHQKKSRNKPDKKGRTRGGQSGHQGVRRELLPVSEVDDVVQCLPNKRCTCGSQIICSQNYQRHQVHELPIVKLRVTEYQRFIGCCEGCGRRHEGALPAGTPSGMLGVSLLTQLSLLTGAFRLSKRLAALWLSMTYGLQVSIGTLSKAEKTLSAALEVPTQEITDALHHEKMVNVDETGHKEQNARAFLWTKVSASFTLFKFFKGRGSEWAKLLIGEIYKGYLTTDRYSSYTWFDDTRHQFCWAHLIRDFQKLAERPGRSAIIGKRLLYYSYRLFHYWHLWKQEEIEYDVWKKKAHHIRRRVECLLIQGTGCEHVRTEGTCRQILKVEKSLWLFVSVLGLEPTNNAAERALRPFVIWRKLCFGTQSARGSRYIERLLSVISTCQQQQRNTVEFIQQALTAYLKNTPPPSLLPETASV